MLFIKLLKILLLQKVKNICFTCEHRTKHLQTPITVPLKKDTLK